MIITLVCCLIGFICVDFGCLGGFLGLGYCYFSLGGLLVGTSRGLGSNLPLDVYGFVVLHIVTYSFCSILCYYFFLFSGLGFGCVGFGCIAFCVFELGCLFRICGWCFDCFAVFAAGL